MNYIKLQKRTARKLFNLGFKITVCPCKYNVNSEHWCCKDTFEKKQYKHLTFDRIIDSFTYYVCNRYVGLYCSYYVNKEDFENYKNLSY